MTEARAWQVAGGFGLDQLTRVAVPVVDPGPGRIRLRLLAVSLNYRDLLMVRGAYDPRQPLPLVPCSDGVGVVDAVGAGVTRVAVGDRVLPIFAESWLSGEPTRAQLRSTRGGPLPGTLQDLLELPADAVVPAPAHLSDEACATLPCAAVTAWRALDAGGVGAGDVVVTQGTGGVSSFAVQLGRIRGARVFVTSRSAEKLSRALGLGAEGGHCTAEDPDWWTPARAFSGGGGADLIVELGGASTLDGSLRAVRPGGTVALIGILGGNAVELPLTRIFMQGVRAQGILVGHRAHLEAVCRALAAHPQVQPVIDRVYAFCDAPAAFARMASGEHQGKLVVRVSEG